MDVFMSWEVFTFGAVAIADVRVAEESHQLLLSLLWILHLCGFILNSGINDFWGAACAIPRGAWASLSTILSGLFLRCNNMSFERILKKCGFVIAPGWFGLEKVELRVGGFEIDFDDTRCKFIGIVFSFDQYNDIHLHLQKLTLFCSYSPASEW